MPICQSRACVDNPKETDVFSAARSLSHPPSVVTLDGSPRGFACLSEATPSLQLLQLTEHGRGLLASRRKSLLLATGILVAGGTAAYAHSRFSKQKSNTFGHFNGIDNDQEKSNKAGRGQESGKKASQKKGGLKSLQVLTAILLSKMGQMGARDLLALIGIVNMAYYKISHVDGRISNPEQRIASDVPRFCSELSDLVQDDLTAVADGLLYTWRLCSYASPKYVFWILAYVMGAGAMIRNFSPAFGKLMSIEQQLEGEYRQVHSRLRTHAESIAFYGGEKREASHIQQKSQNLVKHMRVVLHDHWWFGMIQDFLLKYLGATVAVILIIEPFFAGDLRPDTSTLGRAEMLSNLRYHTSVIISLFQSLGTLSISSRRLNRLSGYADRIHELMVISRELSGANEKYSSRGNGNQIFSEANFIQFSNVKVVTPTQNVLVEDLTLTVESGSNLLITGPNGSGKSSLFRVLGGLWPLVSGHIANPGVGSDLNKEIFYVPQRLYTAFGTLRDQLIYPLTEDPEVDLEYLLDRYPPEKEINWGDELSLGEQQRLGMARLFYHKPKFAILDECTSAVTTDMEERFCAKVLAMGTSCITISHRPALVAFHDVVLSLDGEGGWSVHYKRKLFCCTEHKRCRDDSPVLTEAGSNRVMSSETERQSDAMAVQRAFATNAKDSAFSKTKAQSYVSEVIARSPSTDNLSSLPLVPQLKSSPRILPLRVAALFKVLVPTVLDKQGAQLLAVAVLVLSRTWVSDRIASLNGTTVKYVLEQDKASFTRLIGVSVLQSAASSFIAPSLSIWLKQICEIGSRDIWYKLIVFHHLTARLALGWRIRLTQHLLKNYLRNNAFYKVFNMSSRNIDADQRITTDLEKLTTDLSGLVTGMVKPSVDILWFTWRMKLLTGRRGVAILYAYMLLGLGFLRTVTPDFGDLTSQQQQLEGTFRWIYMNSSLLPACFLPSSSESKCLLTTDEVDVQSGVSASDAILPSKSSNLHSEDNISFYKVDIITPAQKLLARKFTCDIVPGKSLLVTDQRSGDSTHLDMHLKTILENVRLNYLLEREGGSWDANKNWEDVLSLGEQQRLGMARLFFHKPLFGILDECTNATSVDVEEHLYRLAADMGITVVTSSQRPALIPFHSLELRLIDGEGLVGCSLQHSERCLKTDITINQVLLGRKPSGIPIFLVEVMNECSSACTIANVCFHCGKFSSDNRIRPKIFKRLDYDDCLVNNGTALTPGQVLSFKYSTTCMYPLSVSNLDISCYT
ncbi:ABC transporter D family member 1-like [Eucalyptus grandis]|uniref:ABC transporter D family member 1-like n=1 Tax=Eucalyptus grandis TaxID=71139 RepID=UPI00192F0760|nr:ABC transporter D family member 1-like [Eucalyptus grandis]